MWWLMVSDAADMSRLTKAITFCVIGGLFEIFYRLVDRFMF